MRLPMTGMEQNHWKHLLSRVILTISSQSAWSAATMQDVQRDMVTGCLYTYKTTETGQASSRCFIILTPTCLQKCLHICVCLLLHVTFHDSQSFHLREDIRDHKQQKDKVIQFCQTTDLVLEIKQHSFCLFRNWPNDIVLIFAEQLLVTASGMSAITQFPSTQLKALQRKLNGA